MEINTQSLFSAVKSNTVHFTSHTRTDLSDGISQIAFYHSHT